MRVSSFLALLIGILPCIGPVAQAEVDALYKCKDGYGEDIYTNAVTRAQAKSCTKLTNGHTNLIPDSKSKAEVPSKPKATAVTSSLPKDCPDCPEMVVIPAGNYLMGSPEDDPFSNISLGKEEKPQHRVQIQSFAMGKYEITQEQYYLVMGVNPSFVKGRNLPAYRVSWNDAQKFIDELNKKTGQKYRLPTEAEWEYSARAGTTTHWSHGNDSSKLSKYAWFYSGDEPEFREVGKKLPNAFGLYDTHGNVWEWVQDCWHDSYAQAPKDGSAWVTDCSDITSGVIRGGGWKEIAWYTRPAKREKTTLTDVLSTVGFRVAKTLP